SALIGDPRITRRLLSNPRASFNHKREDGTRQSFEAKELIYAVQYRQVKFDCLMENMDKLCLSRKSCWKIMAGEEDEGEDENVEAVLASEEESEDKEGKVVFADENGERFIIS